MYKGDAIMSKHKSIYDGVSMEQFANAMQLISNNTRYDSEMKLTDLEEIALARILAYDGINGDGRHYEHVVDFLWMAHRISTTTKLKLLDLMGSNNLIDMLNGKVKGETT